MIRSATNLRKLVALKLHVHNKQCTTIRGSFLSFAGQCLLRSIIEGRFLAIIQAAAFLAVGDMDATHVPLVNIFRYNICMLSRLYAHVHLSLIVCVCVCMEK